MSATNAAAEAKPTLEQQRASFALQKIRDLQNGELDYGHYVSYVSALPATIVTNGLGQALTTLVAKAKGKAQEPHRILFDHIAAWLSQRIDELQLRVPGNDFTQVIDLLMQADQRTYVRAQAEAMAFLNWLKQFSRAYLKEKEGQGD
ncbi:MAG: type III-B CRISPR module-associated protein Cmr5 [Candidatus Paceibacterota bacterium]